MKIIIPGKPKAQMRHKFGRGFVYDPSKKDKANFFLIAKQFAPKQPLEGDICLKARFYMPRPKNHYRGGKFAGILKDTAPMLHTVRPDIDNLLKFIMDALNIEGVFYGDDSIICQIYAEKIYDENPRTEITLERSYHDRQDEDCSGRAEIAGLL